MSRHHQKFEREIEEILARLDDFPRKRQKIRFRRKVANVVNRVGDAVGAVTSRLNAGQVMLAGIVLAVGAYVFGDLLFGSVNPDLTRYAIILGALLFVGAFIASLLPRGAVRRQQYRWRGRVIEIERPTLTDRMRGFWHRLTRRR